MLVSYQLEVGGLLMNGIMMLESIEGHRKVVPTVIENGELLRSKKKSSSYPFDHN